MALKIVRNDITKMNTEAIVNTANEHPTIGTGCDSAVYKAAGSEELLAYRKKKIGYIPQGSAFITPGFKLQAKYIIHAVSPIYKGGNEGEEEKLRSCYRKSLQLANGYGIKSVAFPLISTGGFGYPKEEGVRIAVDEINTFLLSNDMDVFLVVFDDTAKFLGKRIYSDLEEYIDRRYVDEKYAYEYSDFYMPPPSIKASIDGSTSILPVDPVPIEAPKTSKAKGKWFARILEKNSKEGAKKPDITAPVPYHDVMLGASVEPTDAGISGTTVLDSPADNYSDFVEEHEKKISERIEHISDTFSEYLMYLIRNRKMENAEVYKRAIVDKKVFSKIKNNVSYHPQKLTALCLCVGAKLNLDESKDLLARAGYALSPCDKTDIIFSYFIENQIYDMIELDIQLEEHGLPCIIT